MTMRVRLFAALLATTITGCDPFGAADPDAVSDLAVGTYDMQAAQTRTANCGGELGTIVNGVVMLAADKGFTKIDINTTPGGSNVCGFLGGTWTRVDATTLTLTPGIAGLNPVQATIAGNDLTLEFPTPVAYKRRP